MKKYSRILAVCLALSLLAACGAPAPAGTDGPAGSETPAAASPGASPSASQGVTEPVGTPESLPAEVTEPVDYGPEIVDLSRFEGINYLACQGESCWFTTGNVKRECKLWCYDAGSGSITGAAMPYVSLPDGTKPSDCSVQRLMAVEGGVIAQLSLSGPEGQERAYVLLDGSGRALHCFYASSLLDEGEYFVNVPTALATEDGRLYIVSDETGIVELSPEFEIARREDIPESLGAIRSAELTEDGLRLAFYSIDGEYYDVDLDTFEFTPVDLAESAGRDFPLVELGIGLDGYGGEGTLADGRVVVLRTDGYERTGCLYIADPAQLEKDTRTRLTLVGLDLDSSPTLLEAAADFNRTSQTCRIVPHDYLRADEAEASHTLAYAELLEDVCAGQVPDILSTWNLPTEELAARGLLADLWPLIDAAGARGELYTPFLEALSESSGGLYELPGSMTLCALAGSKSDLGEGRELDFESLYEAVSNSRGGSAAFGPDATRGELLSYFGGLNSFVDWEKGECSFDGGSFASLLRLTSLFPKSAEDAFGGWGEPRQRFYMIKAYDATSLVGLVDEFGDELALQGLPGTGDRAWYLSCGGWAVSEACPDKSGAWDFLSLLVSEDSYGDMSSLPVNRAALEERLKAAEGQNADAAQLLRELLEETDGCTRGYITDSWELARLAEEPLELCYSGAIDAEGAAQLLQSRAADYLGGLN